MTGSWIETPGFGGFDNNDELAFVRTTKISYMNKKLNMYYIRNDY
jgi:hypothetical protein